MGVSKILVRTPNWIGDHVLAMGFYQELRAFYKTAEIVFLSKEPEHIGIITQLFIKLSPLLLKIPLH